jgi:O-antigen/teichoic acid export membrane protein
MPRHSIYYLGIRAINGAIGLTSIYILTRLLSAEQYGLYALGLASINVGASVLFQWLNAGVSRLYASHTGHLSQFFIEVSRLFKYASSVGLILLLIWLAARPESAVSTELSLIIAFGALGMGAYNLHLQIHNARSNPLQYGMLATSRAALVLALSASAALAGFGANGALLGVGIGATIAAYLFRNRWENLPSGHEKNKNIRPQLIRYGIPLALTYAATMVIDVSDRFLIGWLYGPSSVAGYSVSYDLTQQTVGVMLNVFFLSYFPKIVNSWESNGPTVASQSVRPLAHILLFLAGFSVGVFIGLTEEIVKFAIGPELRKDAILVMPWVAAAIAVGCMKGYLFDIPLQLEKRTGTLIKITIAMAIINLALNLLLLPKIGILGSAISAAIAFSAGAGLSYFAGRNANLLPRILIDSIKILFSMTAMCLFFEFLPKNTSIEINNILLLLIKMISGFFIFTASAIITDFGRLRGKLFSLIKDCR